MCLPVQPFKIEREWEHAGLQCAVVMAREASHRCGYVRVPPGHPLHGKSYDEPDVDVHGGLTFAEAEPCAHDDGTGWWFGFDFAHAGDSLYDLDTDPALLSEETRKCLQIHIEISAKYPSRMREHYWTQPEVEAQTERLAEQLAAISGSAPITLDLNASQDIQYGLLAKENADVF